MLSSGQMLFVANQSFIIIAFLKLSCSLPTTIHLVICCPVGVFHKPRLEPLTTADGICHKPCQYTWIVQFTPMQKKIHIPNDKCFSRDQRRDLIKQELLQKNPFKQLYAKPCNGSHYWDSQKAKATLVEGSYLIRNIMGSKDMLLFEYWIYLISVIIICLIFIFIKMHNLMSLNNLFIITQLVQ